MNIKRELKKTWEEIKNTPKPRIIEIITESIYLTVFLLTYVFYILLGTMQVTNNYVAQVGQEQTDPLLILALGGFMLLGLWFSLTWLPFTCSKWTTRLILKVWK